MTTITLRLPRTLAQSSRTHQFPIQFIPIRPASTIAQKKKQPQTPKPTSKPIPKTPQKKQQQQAHQPLPAKYKPAGPNAVTKPLPALSKPVPQSATPSPSTGISTDADIVNGPATTRPPILETPERAPNQAFFFKYALALGKSYVAFYKAGVKNILTNYKATRPIQTRLNQSYKGDLQAAVTGGGLNRQEFQLLTRNWHDVKRVPVFGLVLLVCGEFTPFVVLALSNVVPWTCRIPKQIDGERRKLEQRRSVSSSNLQFGPDGPPKQLAGFGRMELLHLDWSLGLSSSMWDWIFPGRLPGLPTSVVRRRVQDRLKYLTMDDALIEKAGGVRGMDEEEVRMACVERGINVLTTSSAPGEGAKQAKRDVEGLKKELEAWLAKKANGTAAESILLGNNS